MGKKTRWKTEEMGKWEKKWSEKWRKKGNCQRPYSTAGFEPGGPQDPSAPLSESDSLCFWCTPTLWFGSIFLSEQASDQIFRGDTGTARSNFVAGILNHLGSTQLNMNQSSFRFGFQKITVTRRLRFSTSPVWIVPVELMSMSFLLCFGLEALT
ncbi:hypothetical protein B0H16DRAFT_1465255 [Mycena metata]|uniref:Uncharacterized protein n=1 Tax=Mycena metata TaxID=1033252 RepID=A0AAD7MZS1_9AGAR|nr:hypothetical protein B0H16DRAFT_1465255 [Mycena metata]